MRIPIVLVCLQAEFLSVDPYQRAYVKYMKDFPMTMIGSTVAKVIESKEPEYPVGTRIVAQTGWVRVGKLPAKAAANFRVGDSLPSIMKAPDIGNLPSSYLLGACGMPGNTAYYGFLELCKPKEGETVLVNGAAGAVGSLVGQIAKIKGCKVIGYAGSDDKVAWLKQLGFDEALNYKKEDYGASLKRVAPKGIDCFFDNVGGENSSITLANMNQYGRISVCGAISTYNDKNPEKATVIQGNMVSKQLRMEGFHVTRWFVDQQWVKGIQTMAKWVQDGKIQVKETVVDGFDKAPQAFIGMLAGENTGKMVVKA